MPAAMSPKSDSTAWVLLLKQPLVYRLFLRSLAMAWQVTPAMEDLLQPHKSILHEEELSTRRVTFTLLTSSNNVIRKINATTGAITTVAGSGAVGYSGDGGVSTAAELNGPAKVVLDTAGDIYIADTGNSVIRFVNAATGVISTVAGNGTAGYSGDGSMATSAELNHPQGLAVDLGGHVYVADTDNNVIRYFGVGGSIGTLIGTGTAGYSGDNGLATSAELNAHSGRHPRRKWQYLHCGYRQ